jgi:Nucleotide modification associated domain 3
MPKIYLINIGANLAHATKARCPVFVDRADTFEFVAFPDENCSQSYPKPLWRFVRPEWRRCCHLDPDWKHLTYGDNCFNRRARALLSVTKGDILLFWSLLWKVRNGQEVWTSTERGWFLIGALRVGRVLFSGHTIRDLPVTQRSRVKHNAHITGTRVETRPLIRVFIGDPEFSCRFHRAVDLGIYEVDSLLRNTIRCADGRAIQWRRSPRWNSVMRGCRAVLDLDAPEDLRRAKLLRKAIMRANPHFDLLENVGPDVDPSD